MRKTVTLTLLLMLGIFFSISMLRRTYDVYTSGTRLDREQQSVKKLQQEHDELTKKLVRVGSEEYIQQEARDKLNMSLANETTIVLDQPQPPTQEQSTEMEMAQLPNWQRWWHLFFN